MICAVLMLVYILVKLIVIVGLRAGVMIYKMVQTLFLRVDPSQPGRTLRREGAPISSPDTGSGRKIGTRPLDQIRQIKFHHVAMNKIKVSR